MSEEKVKAQIKTKFDLGYIVELEDGTEAQLRVLEQRGRELKLHVSGEEEKIYGESIEVYEVYRDSRYCAVSQYSPLERTQREEAKQKERLALENCTIGGEHHMEVEKDYEWGYILKEIEGCLVGAIKKPCQKLSIGERVHTVIVSKASSGSPYMEIRKNA